MKKNYLLGMALIASLSFNSCTKEIVYVQDGTESIAEDVQQITLQVENGGDSQKSRAGRPMYGAEAKQDIQPVVTAARLPSNWKVRINWVLVLIPYMQ